VLPEIKKKILHFIDRKFAPIENGVCYHFYPARKNAQGPFLVFPDSLKEVEPREVEFKDGAILGENMSSSVVFVLDRKLVILRRSDYLILMIKVLLGEKILYVPVGGIDLAILYSPDSDTVPFNSYVRIEFCKDEPVGAELSK
jgi:hypothetical protein